MNCSGKHAAMLATCVDNGWDTDSYLAPTIRSSRLAATFAELTGETVEVVGGRRVRCTAAVDLAGRAGAGLPGAGGRPRRARAPDRRGDPPTRRMSRGPPATSSASSPRSPGAIGKAGAESCHVVALPDGRAFALKTDDGAPTGAAGPDGGRPPARSGVDRRTESTVPRSGRRASSRCSVVECRSGKSARRSDAAPFDPASRPISTWKDSRPIPRDGTPLPR